MIVVLASALTAGGLTVLHLDFTETVGSVSQRLLSSAPGGKAGGRGAQWQGHGSGGLEAVSAWFDQPLGDLQM